MVISRNSLPHLTVDMAGKVMLVEAAAGVTRHNMLTQWLQQAEQRMGAVGWMLPCAFDDGGAWAGLQTLVQSIVPDLEQHAPELLTKHSYELCLAAPALRERIHVSHLTLTDISQGHERVRSYALDRAYRNLHGLIDLLEQWYALNERRPLVIVCDQYDLAGPFVQRFFTELMRRRGQPLQITLLLAVEPGQGNALVDQYASEFWFSRIQLGLSADAVVPASQEQIIQEAHELEMQVEQDIAVADTFTPRLISLLEQSGQMRRALHWKVRAANRFNQLGLYEASFRYCEAIEANLDLLRDDDPQLYLIAILTLYFCYIPLQHTERAYHVMMEHVTDQLPAQPFVAQCYYLIAMLHARFLPQRDLSTAIDYLEQGQRLIAKIDVAEATRYFHVVFLNNGLAYIRVQQKNAQAAVALCREGLALLDLHLSPDEHRLHRSVLLYNIAQVYAATKQYDEAIATFEEALKMDPHYSEYYNERGNIYLVMGRLAEAEQDYLQAIELSPPYAEVWTNLGQCYREIGRVDEAIAAYTRALDLSPTEALPLVGRAEMYTELGRWEDALADYHAALQIEPQAPVVLAARAVAYYEAGQVGLAVADLDAAIALAPANAVFYQNRAMALIDLERVQEAARDLRMYLQLQPDAEDWNEVEQQLMLLAHPE